ncbi:MAG: hypothetical protein RL333_51 [Pseudomonadota bacterium]|jgi:hypothetical protein
MKSSIAIILLTLSFLPAHAGVAGKAETPSSMIQCNDVEKHPKSLQQSLNELETNLKLTSTQAPLWEEWSAKLITAHQIKDKFKKDEQERRKLPAPLRQEQWMASVQEHLNAMKASLPFLKSLYSSFNGDQKSLFDHEVPFKHHANSHCGNE